MCGIAGYYNPKPEKYIHPQTNVADLLCLSQSRGSDASGIGFIENGNLFNLKLPMPAYQFVATKNFKKTIKTIKPYAVIGHTRMKTQGVASNNYNNHPIVTKSGIGIVHNGIISNDLYLFNHYNLKRDGEVDSEIIIKMIEFYKTGFKKNTTAITKAVKKIDGNQSVAMLDRNEPDTLYLWNEGNPLALALEIKTGVIYFASEIDILREMLLRTRTYYDIFSKLTNWKDYIFLSPDDIEKTGYKITPIGITEFKVEQSDYDYQQRNFTPSTNYSDDDDDYDNLGEPKNEPKNANDYVKKPKMYESHDDFTEPIKKPSKYLSMDLERRLEMLDIESENRELTRLEIEEMRRLDNCLTAREAELVADNRPPFDKDRKKIKKNIKKMSNKFKKKLNKSKKKQLATL